MSFPPMESDFDFAYYETVFRLLMSDYNKVLEAKKQWIEKEGRVDLTELTKQEANKKLKRINRISREIEVLNSAQITFDMLFTIFRATWSHWTEKISQVKEFAMTENRQLYNYGRLMKDAYQHELYLNRFFTDLFIEHLEQTKS